MTVGNFLLELFISTLNKATRVHLNMKTLLLFSFMLIALSYSQETLEDLNLEALLSDDAKRNAAFDCLMDKAPCGELQQLRDSIPQMLETQCGQCSPKQKEKFQQASKLLFEKYPKQFQDLMLKYSPQSN